MVRRFSLVIFGLAVVFTSPHRVLAQCSQAPQTTALNDAWLRFLTAQAKKSGPTTIALMPFFDDATAANEPLISSAVPFAIYDRLDQSRGGVMSPYVSFRALEELGIVGEKLLLPESAAALANKLGARLVIFGSLQRATSGEVRVFLDVYDSKSQASLSPKEQFGTDLNDAFFAHLDRAVVSALKRSAVKLKPHTGDFPTMMAFRFYAKGMMQSAGYDTPRLSQAVLWFEKALKERYLKYDEAALGLVRAHSMLFLLHKLAGAGPVGSAAAADTAMILVSAGFSRDSDSYHQASRFKAGQTAFLTGLTLLKGGKKAAAGQKAALGLSLVPEDGMLQNLYLQAQGDPHPDKTVKIDNAVCF